MKTEDHKVERVPGTTKQGHKEETRIHVPPTASVAGGKHPKSRKSKHKRLMPQAIASADGKLY